jgi:hypothetical protein
MLPYICGEQKLRSVDGLMLGQSNGGGGTFPADAWNHGLWQYQRCPRRNVSAGELDRCVMPMVRPKKPWW